MDRTIERLGIARKALDTLKEIDLINEPTAIVRDAAIQRFEYTFEAIWKAAQIFLREIEKMELGSPRSVIRASFQADLLNEDETRSTMLIADDRNLTVHTYNENLAQKLFERLSSHVDILESWLKAMEERVL